MVIIQPLTSICPYLWLGELQTKVKVHIYSLKVPDRQKTRKVVEMDLPVYVIVVYPKHKCYIHRKLPFQGHQTDTMQPLPDLFVTGKRASIQHFHVSPEYLFQGYSTDVSRGVHFTSYKFFQIGFFFSFPVNSLHLILTLLPKALYHTISFQTENYIEKASFA